MKVLFMFVADLVIGRTNSAKVKGNKSHPEWNVSRTAEWNYPETLAITESEEISELGRFIYDKVCLHLSVFTFICLSVSLAFLRWSVTVSGEA